LKKKYWVFSKNRIIKFDPQGNELARTQIYNASNFLGIASWQNGNFIVGDSACGSFVVFDSSCTRKTSILAPHSATPYGVTVDRVSGNIIASCSSNLHILTQDGGLICTIKHDDFTLPLGVGVYTHSNIIVPVPTLKKLHIYNSNGEFLQQILCDGYHPYGVTVDFSGRIIVVTWSTGSHIITFA